MLTSDFSESTCFCKGNKTKKLQATLPKDGKLHNISGFIGIKKRYLKQRRTQKEDWAFYIYYRVGGRKGKQVLKKIGNQSQGMTARKAQRIRLQQILRHEEILKNEKNTSTKNITIEQIWQEYKNQKNTLSSFHSIKNLYKYLSPFYQKNPSVINNKEIRTFRDELENHISKRQKRLSTQTIVHIIKLLKTLINFASKNDLCAKNEKLSFNLPCVYNKVQEFLSPKQLKAYLLALDNVADIHARAFLLLALYTGMRKKALLFLKWDDIDFTHNLIFLQAEHAKKKSPDYIPLPHALKKILWQLKNKNNLHPNRHIFLDTRKKPLAPYFSIAKEIKEKIGLPRHFRPLYMLRHNFASMLACHGVDLYTIQKMLTHENSHMTERYAHLNNKSLMQASQLVCKVIDRARG